MNSVLEKKENNKATFKIEISEDKFNEAIQKSYLKNRNKFNIPGFRKGKAPRKIIEMNYGEEIFYEDAINIVLPESYDESIKNLELEPVDYPEIDIEQLEKGKPIIFKVEVVVKPEVKLGEYKGVEVEKVEYNVTDEDVQKELESIQDMNARLIEAEDRETKAGDVLTIDFEGYVDGKQFEGGSAENQPLELGSNRFIPGFEEQLIGKKKGDSVDVKVQFPEDYFSEDLAGKDALFKVEIKEVKEKEYPDLDDEFAKDVSEFDTLDELKKDIEERLIKEAKERETIENQSSVIEKVMDSAEIEIPEVMIENQIKNDIYEFEYGLRMQGLNIDQYFELTNTSLDDLKEQIRPNAEKKVRMELVLEEISKIENIEAADDEIDEKLEKMAKDYNSPDVDKFKENMIKGDLEYIKSGIIRDKTIEVLMANAKLI
jgi:trigger factor